MRLILLLFLCFSSFVANADMFKCKDASGKIGYQDYPCTTTTISYKKNVPSQTISYKKNVPTQAKILTDELKRRSSEEPITKETQDACLDEFRPMLKDPRSAYVQEAFKSYVTNSKMKNERAEVVLDARAKNSFGGFIPQAFVCGINDDGSIDKKGTETYKALFRLGLPLI